MAEGMTIKLILAFVTLIVGLALLGSVSTETVAKTKTTSITNESISVSSVRCLSANAPCAAGGTGNHTNSSEVLNWKTTLGETSADCPLTSIELRNYTNGTVATSTYNISYSIDTGVVNLQFANNTNDGIQSGSVSNTTWIDYSYCPSGYLIQQWQRSTLNVVPGFFAIALMLVAVGLFFSVYLDWKRK